jgi:hypothetical protein
MNTQTESQLVQAVEEQNRLLRALIAVTVDSYLRDNPDVASPRFRSIDQLLSVAGGLRNSEIAVILNKTPQAVGQVLLKGK